MTYTLTTSALLYHVTGSTDNVTGQAGVAMIDDGSYLVAAVIAGATDVVRLWRLAATDLAILGTADVAVTVSSGYPAILLVPLPGEKALMLYGTGDSGGPVSTWVVDCGPLVPVVATPVVTASEAVYGAFYSAAWWCRIQGFITIVGRSRTGAVTNIQTWTDGGVLVSELVDTDGEEVAGLWVDPADPAKGVWVGGSGGHHDFTVGTDGTLTAASRSAWVPLLGDYALLVGSGALMAEAWDSGAHHYVLNLQDFSGTAIGAPYAEGPWQDLVWPSGCAFGSTRVVGGGPVSNDTYSLGYAYRFDALDFSVTPPAMDHLILPLPAPLVPLDGDVTGLFGQVGADYLTGRILTSAVHVSDNAGADLSVWLIQGPANMPNLSGQLLDNRVRFT